jgi:nucleotide-binding universal stress UspA family protein
MIALKNILVATDFEEAADAALTYGRTLAHAFGATLHVLHVTDDVRLAATGAEFYVPLDPTLQAEVDEAARIRLASLVIDSDGSGPRTKTAIGTSRAPAPVIVEYARANGIDLIVMGTHGRKALAHLLMGSVAERVVRTAPCPVLTVHHPEHEFVLPDILATVVKAKAQGRARRFHCTTG